MTHPKRRSARYGRCVRGWDWRATPELLAEAEELRQRLRVDKTQLIEDAVRAYIAQHRGEQS